MRSGNLIKICAEVALSLLPVLVFPLAIALLILAINERTEAAPGVERWTNLALGLGIMGLVIGASGIWRRMRSDSS